MAVQPERFAYGSDPSQYGEWTSAGRSDEVRGVAVVIHGGFWKAHYDLSLGRPLATSLTQHGWHVWNIEYRRVGNGGGGYATLDDVASAIDYLSVIGPFTGGLTLNRFNDGDHVVTIGHSAGGHLAVWAAGRGRFSRWVSNTHDRSQPLVRLSGAISQAGVLDLRAARADRLSDDGDAVDRFVGGAEVAIGADIDPIQNVPLEVPVLCVHGADDVNVPIGQSTSYVQRATEAGGDARLEAVDGDHFTVIDPASAAWHTTLRALDEMSDRSG